MFKKLKQRIEDGGDTGLERVSFAPTRLPGSIVRSRTPPNGENLLSTGSQPDLALEQPTQLAPLPSEIEINGQSGEIPTHLNCSQISHQALLRSRVRALEQECVTLKEQLREVTSQCTAQQLEFEKQIEELDQQRTVLKMEVIELELEKAVKLQECEAECTTLQDELLKRKELASHYQSIHSAQVLQLKEAIEAKEKCIIVEENRYSALQKKAYHFESQLRAYENSSENEVVTRLHQQVADVEQRVKTRALEIQILERRLASQAKENDEHMEKFLKEQKEQEKARREAVNLAKEEKSARKELLKELEKLQLKHNELEREKGEIMSQLSCEIAARQRFAVKYGHMQSTYDARIQDLDHCIEDKDAEIKELVHRLKQQSEHAILEPIPRPPGMPRRTASIGVQVNQSEPRTVQPQEIPSNTESLNEVEMLQQQQCRLEEELAEKVKIIKVQQQKIMDIKKELRLKVASDEKVCGHINRSPSPPSHDSTPDVNFQYLKHVVIKFVCSREDEAFQLVRAISTLLEFSPQEEEHVRQYLNYKMSWFGVIPPPLFPPMQTPS